MRRTYRQGDVLVREVGTRDFAYHGVEVIAENGRIILARGEATGHNHSIDARVGRLFEGLDPGLLAPRRPRPAGASGTLTHKPAQRRLRGHQATRDTNRDRIATLWIRKKLKSLTREQLALLAVVREEWLQAGLATRTEWPAVRRIVPALYSALGFQPPDSVITFDSPREGALAAASTAAGLTSKPHAIRDEIRRHVRRWVCSSVRAKVRDEVRDCVHQELRQQVRHQLRDQIQAHLLSELPHLFFNLGDAAFGLHDAPWLASCDFFSRIWH